MNEGNISRLLDLVAYDQDTIALEKSVEQETKQLLEKNIELETYQLGVKQAKENTLQTKKEVDALELDMKVLDDKTKKTRERLDSSKNQREYDSANKELQEIQEKQQKLEQKLLASWKNFEQAETLLKDREHLYNEHEPKINLAIEHLMQKVAHLKEQIQERLNERKTKLEGLPAELLEKYTVMYAQVKDPIVPTTNGSCSACFYSLVQQDLMNIRRGKLIQCKDCFRFLFEKDRGSHV